MPIRFRPSCLPWGRRFYPVGDGFSPRVTNARRPCLAALHFSCQRAISPRQDEGICRSVPRQETTAGWYFERPWLRRSMPGERAVSNLSCLVSVSASAPRDEIETKIEIEIEIEIEVMARCRVD